MSVATAVARSATRSTSTISRADARSRRANAHAWPTRPAPTTPTFSIIVPAPYAAAAKRSTKPAARAPASFARAHAASSRARARRRASLSARPTASAIGRGRASRRGSRTPAPAQSTRADVSFMSPAAGTHTGTQPPRSASATVPCPAWQTTASQRGIVRPYGIQSTSVALAGTPPGRSSARRSVLATTRTGRSARPSSAARSRRCPRSCDVDGASRTSGSAPGGSATSAAGGSQSSGPTTCVCGVHARGYSSCGNVATRHSAREIPPWTCPSAGRPSRARVSLSSRRPRSRPPATTPSVARHIARPSAVRGRRAPIEYGGIPGAPRGSVWGTSVATGTPSSSPARAGASVRMSLTIACGRTSATSGRVSRTARTTASNGLSGRSRVGKTWYSGAGAKRIPSASTCSAQRRQVCSTTSWPRAASTRPSAIIGNAWPGSPKAPSSSRRGSAGKLGDEPQLLDALVLAARDRRDAERADAGVPVDGKPLADVVGRPAQRHGVDELVRHRGGRLVALAVEVEVLDLLRRRLEAIAHGERVVEVLLAGAHPADVQRDERAHPIARRLQVVVDRDVDRRRDVEAVERAVRPRRALLEQRPEVPDVLGREEDRDPAVGDLARELRVLRPDRREVDRDAVLHRRDRELQRLTRPVRERKLERLAVELEPLAVERSAHDRDVLARALDLAGEALPGPALGHLRARRSDPEQHPPAAELVERRGGHRRHRGRAGRHLEDRRADLDPLGLPGEPPEDRRRVRAVGLGGPDGVVAEALGLEDDLELIGARQAETPVADVHAELHATRLSPPSHRFHRGATA